MDYRQFDSLITIQTPTVATNADGSQASTWSLLCKVWASVEPITARELSIANTYGVDATYRVRVRFDSRLKSAQRIVWNDKGTLRAISVDGVVSERATKGKTMLIFCNEVIL